MSAEIKVIVGAVRRAVALFDLSDGRGSDRGLIEVTGSDALRWLDGMLSNDVVAIGRGSEQSGCYATALTPKGRIIADVHVLARDGGYWLELAADVIPDLVSRLRRYIIADDVELADRTPDFARLGVEGPSASALLLAAAAELGESARLTGLAQDSWCELQIADAAVSAARFGWSGEDAYQLFIPRASRDQVAAALEAAGDGLGLVTGSFAALEVLRIEAGIPRLGAELDEDVFPDEARLDAAISRTKGCYTGQEIVARLYSRGAVNHLLVGLHFDGDVSPQPETELFSDGRRCGEVTSSCVSPTAGAIGLGYLRRNLADPGTVVRAAETQATVVALPIVAAGGVAAE